VATPCRWNEEAMKRGQQCSPYVAILILAMVRGTLMPNSCGGAY
jgi:hypothetical protein